MQRFATPLVLERRLYSILTGPQSLLRRPVAFSRRRYQSSTVSKTNLSDEDKAVSLSNERKAELEKFIPLTRRTLLRMLMEEEGLLSSADKRQMESVAASLDATYSKRFYSILEQSKVSTVYVYEWVWPCCFLENRTLMFCV